MKPIRTYIGVLTRFNRLILVVLLILVIVAIYELQFINVERDIIKFLPENYESRKYIEIYRAEMGDSRYILCVIEAENVLAEPVLRFGINLTAELQTIDGVAEILAPPFELLLLLLPSPNNLTFALSQNQTQPIIAMEVMNYSSKFINSKQTMMLIYIRPVFKPFSKESKTLVRELRDLLTYMEKNYNSRHQEVAIKIHLTGNIVMYYDWDEVYFEGKPRVYITAIILTTLLLYMVFRKVSLVLIGICVIIIAIIFTFGIVGATHPILSIITEIAAIPLIFGIGIDDTIHLIHRYREERLSLSRALKFMLKPMALTSITTTIGFGALCTAELGLISNLGKVVAIGMIIVFITTIVVIPLAIVLLGAKKLRWHPCGRSERSERSEGSKSKQL